MPSGDIAPTSLTVSRHPSSVVTSASMTVPGASFFGDLAPRRLHRLLVAVDAHHGRAFTRRPHCNGPAISQPGRRVGGRRLGPRPDDGNAPTLKQSGSSAHFPGPVATASASAWADGSSGMPNVRKTVDSIR